MKTVIQTDQFTKDAAKIWTEEELFDFIDYISENFLAGDVIPGAEGARKVRWAIKGQGKRGAARVIYFNVDDASLTLIAIYKKADTKNMTAKQIKEVR